MDPITAIGLAASVIQFVQFGLQLAKRLDEFNKANPGEVPRSLQAVSIQIPLLLNALDRIKTESEIKKLDLNTKCLLRGVVAGCHSQIAEVDAMMNEIARTPGEAFKAKIKKVFTSLKYDEKIWVVERNLNTYISVLILHQVIDSSEAPPDLVEDTFFDVREQVVVPFSERPNLVKELESFLYDASRSQVKTPTIVTIVGSKGVGKTQLALSYCHAANSQKQFRTVFWLDASTLENLSLGFESIYATIRRSTSGSREDKINFARAFLDDLWHPWLLVLDNYEPTVLHNEVVGILPTRGYGGIILITRDEKNCNLGSILRVPKFLTAQDQLHLNSLLTKEVQNKNVNRIYELVDQGADVNSLIWNEWPCLHRCALFGLHDTVMFLLDRGASLNPPVQLQKPLYWAASGGHESICRLLLEHEDEAGQTFKPADIQAAFDAAADEGSVDILRLLSSRRSVKLNNKNQHGRLPVTNAAGKGNVDVLNFLMDQGALKENPMHAEQAFLIAASHGHFEIVKILYTKGKVNPNCRNEEGTALYHAAGLQNASYKESGIEMAEFLLANGADPNLLGSNGPLHTAAIREHINMIQLLLKHGADPTKDCGGWDPLTNAIKYKSPKAVNLLLEAEIEDSKARSVWLNRGLRYACREGEREVILQLLNAGADINAVEEAGNPKGASPLLLAILYGNIKAAQLLIRRGAKQEVGDDSGRFPLSTAAELGYDSLVRDLIRAGGDPNMQSGLNEDTLLILAAGKKQEKVVKVLLDNNADRMLANKFGDIALDVAEENGHKEIIEMLEK